MVNVRFIFHLPYFFFEIEFREREKSYQFKTSDIKLNRLFKYICPQTIKAAHIATVRKLPKPPHLIMRIMDCVLILFRKKLDQVVFDAERNCCKPSWSESLKVKPSLSSPRKNDLLIQLEFSSKSKARILSIMAKTVRKLSFSRILVSAMS